MNATAETFGSPSGEPSTTRSRPQQMCEKLWTLPDSGDFDVANQPPFQIHPVIQSERLIHMYPSPDKKTTPVGVNVTPQSHVQLLKARFSAAPPYEHDSANDTWLNIRIDGQEGWILGVDDYTALGLSFAE